MKTIEARRKCRFDRWEREIQWQEDRIKIRELVRKDRAANQEARYKWIDDLAQIESKRTVEFTAGGSLFVVSKEPGYELYEGTARGKRGKIRAFTARSRQRLIEWVSGMMAESLPLFITLTYPDWWPDDWQSWKFHLQTLFKRMRRKWKQASALWKLEPQKRGAPHFHLIVWGVDFMPWEWLATAWFECVGTKEEDHRMAGTRVERARSVRGVQCYVAKKYMGKSFVAPKGWNDVGRYWGVMGRKHAPRAQRIKVEIGKADAFKFRRLIRKHFKLRGIKRDKFGARRLGRLAVFTQSQYEWARALASCCGAEIEARQIGFPLGSCPF